MRPAPLALLCTASACIAAPVRSSATDNPRAAIPRTVALDYRSPTPQEAPALPLRLPGYELRVLDQRKLLFVAAGDSWFEIPLPIFFYYPTADRSEADRLIRDAAQALRAMIGSAAARPELESLARQLERASALLGS